MKENQTSNYAWWLTGLSLIMLLSHLAVFPVNIMEARNFITAREMAQDGNWIMTTLNGVPRYEKPPLPTWLTALSGEAFGFGSLFAMRLPVALITLLLVLTSYFFSKRIGLPAKQSFHNALTMLTSFYIYFAGRDNQWDMYCHSFMLVSIYFLWNFFKKEGNSWTQVWWAGVFMGFSILSKGPISLYTLFLPFLIAYGIVYRFSLKKWKKELWQVLFIIIISLVIGVTWFIYVRYADPASFNEVTQREVTRWASYNTRPIYYYWGFFLQTGIWALPTLAALLYPYMKKRVSNLKAYRFTLIWAIGSVVLLSIVPEKKNPLSVARAHSLGTEYRLLHRIFTAKILSNIKQQGKMVCIYFLWHLSCCGDCFSRCTVLCHQEHAAGIGRMARAVVCHIVCAGSTNIDRT
ncbi:MAG: glycosyltransferase family 39 protein [Niabella sp.]